MPKGIEEFALVGVENMKFYDMDNKHVTTLKHGKDLEISNDSSTAYMRGGPGNKKLLAIKGDSEATVTLDHASMTVKLWEIVTGNKLTIEKRAIEVDEVHVVSNKKITLKQELAIGEPITVYKVDAHGRDGEELVVGDPSKEGEYSLDNDVFTFHTNVTGRVRVYFSTMKDTQIITSKPTAAQSYRIVSDLICQDIDTKKVHMAQLLIHNGQVQESFSIGATNEATEPAAIPLAIDCLEDSLTGEFYEILFYDRVED